MVTYSIRYNVCTRYRCTEIYSAISGNNQSCTRVTNNAAIRVGHWVTMRVGSSCSHVYTYCCTETNPGCYRACNWRYVEVAEVNYHSSCITQGWYTIIAGTVCERIRSCCVRAWCISNRSVCINNCGPTIRLGNYSAIYNAIAVIAVVIVQYRYYYRRAVVS